MKILPQRRKERRDFLLFLGKKQSISCALYTPRLRLHQPQVRVR